MLYDDDDQSFCYNEIQGLLLQMFEAGELPLECLMLQSDGKIEYINKVNNERQKRQIS